MSLPCTREYMNTAVGGHGRAYTLVHSSSASTRNGVITATHTSRNSKSKTTKKRQYGRESVRNRNERRKKKESDRKVSDAIGKRERKPRKKVI